MNLPRVSLQRGGKPVRIATITGISPDCVMLRVYKISHAARSVPRRLVSSKIISMETAPSVAALMRLARSYDGRRSPLKISDKCEAPQPTTSAKADCVMRPSIQDDSRCGLTMGELCHWQSAASSQKVYCGKIDTAESLDTIRGMARAARKKTLPAVVEAPERVPRKLYLREWLHRLKVKQITAAEAAGIGASYMSSIIKGTKNPSYTILLDITDAIGITVNDLAHLPPPIEEFDKARNLTEAQRVAAHVLARRKR